MEAITSKNPSICLTSFASDPMIMATTSFRRDQLPQRHLFLQDKKPSQPQQRGAGDDLDTKYTNDLSYQNTEVLIPGPPNIRLSIVECVHWRVPMRRSVEMRADSGPDLVARLSPDTFPGILESTSSFLRDRGRE